MEREEVENFLEVMMAELENLGLSGVDMDWVLTTPHHYENLVDGIMERLDGNIR
jgi:hypothetical protein